MPFHMSSEELLRVKKGEHLFIHGKYYEVVSAGHKWIRCKGLQQPINIALAHLQTTGVGSGDMHQIFRTDTLYKLNSDRVKAAYRAYRAMHQVSIHQLENSYEFTADLTALLKKHTKLLDVRE